MRHNGRPVEYELGNENLGVALGWFLGERMMVIEIPYQERGTLRAHERRNDHRL